MDTRPNHCIFPSFTLSAKNVLSKIIKKKFFNNFYQFYITFLLFSMGVEKMTFCLFVCPMFGCETGLTNSFCSDFQFFTFFNVILSTRWRGGVKCSFLVAVTMKSWVQTPVRDFLLLFFSI